MTDESGPFDPEEQEPVAYKPPVYLTTVMTRSEYAAEVARIWGASILLGIVAGLVVSLSGILP